MSGLDIVAWHKIQGFLERMEKRDRQFKWLVLQALWWIMTKRNPTPEWCEKHGELLDDLKGDG